MTIPIQTRYLAIALLGLVASFAIVAEELPMREVTVGLFLAIGPGLGVLWLTNVTDTAARIALVVPLSLAIDALVASIVLYLGIWSPELVTVLIVMLTIGVIAVAPYDRSSRALLVLVALLPGLAILAGHVTLGAIG